MSTIAPADLDAGASADLPAQYASTSVLDLAQCLLSRLQTVDDIARQLQAGLALPDAVGAQLDILGQLVGQPRQGGAYPMGESDAAYRQKIAAAILRNRSGGTVPDLIAVVSELLSDVSPTVIVTQAGTAAFALTVTVSTPLDAGQLASLASFVQAAKAAGVGATIYPSAAPTFAYAGFPDPPFSGYDNGHWAPVLRL